MLSAVSGGLSSGRAVIAILGVSRLPTFLPSQFPFALTPAAGRALPMRDAGRVIFCHFIIINFTSSPFVFVSIRILQQVTCRHAAPRFDNKHAGDRLCAQLYWGVEVRTLTV